MMMTKSAVLVVALCLVPAADAYTFQQGSLRSFARRSSLSMNIENVATKDNVRVGVIGKKTTNECIWLSVYLDDEEMPLLRCDTVHVLTLGVFCFPILIVHVM